LAFNVARYERFMMRWRSFRYAFKGLVHGIRHEHHMKVHVMVAVLVVGIGIWCGLTTTEWALVLLCIAAVMAMELINTAIEHLANVVEPRYDERIARVKDLAAGAVLVVACVAAIVGVLIFWPYTVARFTP
jgi:diacylglycerol kinase